jgi:hypothetical protein
MRLHPLLPAILVLALGGSAPALTGCKGSDEAVTAESIESSEGALIQMVRSRRS